MRGAQPCPFCGLVLITDDAAQSIAHETPECAPFLAAVASVGGKHEARAVRLEEIGEHIDARAEELRRARS